MASNVNDLQQATAGLANAQNGVSNCVPLLPSSLSPLARNPLYAVLRGCELVSSKVLFESLSSFFIFALALVCNCIADLDCLLFCSQLKIPPPLKYRNLYLVRLKTPSPSSPTTRKDSSTSIRKQSLRLLARMTWSGTKCTRLPILACTISTTRTQTSPANSAQQARLESLRYVCLRRTKKNTLKTLPLLQHLEFRYPPFVQHQNLPPWLRRRRRSRRRHLPVLATVLQVVTTYQ